MEQVNSEIPQALADIVMRCLAKSPSDRYARANDLADALIGVLPSLDNGKDAVRVASAARSVAPASR